MGQFGLKMDFLPIKQVSAINLILKIYSKFISLIFLILWTGPHFPESTGTPG
jgi:hypothetical protein